MQPAFNQSITTPLGKGVCTGPMRDGEQVNYLVRLPVNDQTKNHLRDQNCLTPRAQHTGLWKFEESELG